MKIDIAEHTIFEIAEKRFAKSYVGLDKLAHETYDLIYKLYERDKPGLTGVTTGYTLLDELLGGFQKSDFIVIAARPSMGKNSTGTIDRPQHGNYSKYTGSVFLRRNGCHSACCSFNKL